MRQLALRIANVLLFALCCFLLAGVINQTAIGLLRPPPSEGVAGTTRQHVAQRWPERSKILDRNLFGAQVGPPVTIEAPPLPMDPDIEQTKLPLVLLGTIAADNPEVSTAAIRDRSAKRHEVVREGDYLESHPEVEVVGIERKRVILQNGDKREELLLDDENLAAKPKTRSPRRTARRERPSRSTGRTDLAARLSELRNEAGEGNPRSPSNVFSQARILPKYEDGSMVGIQLNAIKPGSFYEKLGLKDGDIITELNGIAIDNAAASAKILGEFTTAEEFQILVRSGDSVRSLAVDPDQVLRLLE